MSLSHFETLAMTQASKTFQPTTRKIREFDLMQHLILSLCIRDVLRFLTTGCRAVKKRNFEGDVKKKTPLHCSLASQCPLLGVPGTKKVAMAKEDKHRLCLHMTSSKLSPCLCFLLQQIKMDILKGTGTVLKEAAMNCVTPLWGALSASPEPRSNSENFQPLCSHA